ncbi:MAG: hypothetical protein R6U98_17960 [Pirellulaceae bacterium]
MRDLVMTDEFLSALEAMSADKREHALKKLRLLAADPRYPSLAGPVPGVHEMAIGNAAIHDR